MSAGASVAGMGAATSAGGYAGAATGLAQAIMGIITQGQMNNWDKARFIDALNFTASQYGMSLEQALSTFNTVANNAGQGVSAGYEMSMNPETGVFPNMGDAARQYLDKSGNIDYTKLSPNNEQALSLLSGSQGLYDKTAQQGSDQAAAWQAYINGNFDRNSELASGGTAQQGQLRDVFDEITNNRGQTAYGQNLQGVASNALSTQGINALGQSRSDLGLSLTGNQGYSDPLTQSSDAYLNLINNQGQTDASKALLALGNKLTATDPLMSDAQADSFARETVGQGFGQRVEAAQRQGQARGLQPGFSSGVGNAAYQTAIDTQLKAESAARIAMAQKQQDAKLSQFNTGASALGNSGSLSNQTFLGAGNQVATAADLATKRYLGGIGSSQAETQMGNNYATTLAGLGNNVTGLNNQSMGLANDYYQQYLNSITQGTNNVNNSAAAALGAGQYGLNAQYKGLDWQSQYPGLYSGLNNTGVNQNVNIAGQQNTNFNTGAGVLNNAGQGALNVYNTGMNSQQTQATNWLNFANTMAQKYSSIGLPNQKNPYTP
jgi:hypothetical protein